ncbi:MAG: YgjV family protein [Clostridia bacterium]|nr:YgjV family protein [Clostridia bacterium]
MTYYIGQILGILVTAGVVISLQMKKKWQMLLVSVAVNLLAAANILLLDQINSAVLVNCLACVQIGVSLWHDHRGTKVTLAEKIIFLALYLSLGIMGYEKPMDLLSILAAMLYMLSVFQKKEQYVRLFLMGNMSVWTVYHLILGSTAVFAQLAGITSSVIAIIRYKKSSC